MKGRGRAQFSPELMKLLATGQMGECRLVPLGSNYTFYTTVSQGASETCRVVYKPQQGEAPLWDFPYGTLYLREYAAYLLSEALGWCFVPPTVIRNGVYGVGTVQLYVETVPDANYVNSKGRYREEFLRLCAFDIIANNADRKAGHCLVGKDGNMWAIDHGICFNSQPKLRTVVWDYAGEKVPESIQKDMAELLESFDQPGSIGDKLATLLNQEEVDAFCQRLETLIENPVFPFPGSRRSVPWPPV